MRNNFLIFVHYSLNMNLYVTALKGYCFKSPVLSNFHYWEWGFRSDWWNLCQFDCWRQYQYMVYSYIHKEKWWWHLWAGSLSQSEKLILISSGNIQKRLILIIWNQSRLWRVGCVEREEHDIYIAKPSIHKAAGSEINKMIFATSVGHMLFIIH